MTACARSCIERCRGHSDRKGAPIPPSLECVLTDLSFGVGTATLNRPGARNALSRCLITELLLAVQRFESSPDVRVIVIQGNAKAFSSGADLGEVMGSTSETGTSSALRLEDISCATKPIIAAVSGYALGGGCELALMADMIIASESAEFGLPEVGLGIIPGAGGTQRLPRAIGRGKASDLILTGRRLGAREAESAGLVSRVVDDSRLEVETRTVAMEMAQKPLSVLLAAKRALRAAESGPLSQGLAVERAQFRRLVRQQLNRPNSC